MSKMRTALMLALAPALIAATATMAAAGWQLSFVPDAGTFKVDDVITGRTHIRYVAGGRAAGDQPAWVRCNEARFYVTGPDGSTTGMTQNSQRYYAESWPFRLADGEEVLLPVCLAKWEGRWVFPVEGEYRIVVSLTLLDMKTNKPTIATAAPVSIRIVRAGNVPQAYLDALDLPEICGTFRYGCRKTSIFDVNKLELGNYEEPFFAFMTYQLWHTGVRSYVIYATREQLQFVNMGMSLVRSRNGGLRSRGDWIIKRLEAMRSARFGQYGEVTYGAGDVLFAWPESL